jgi:Protein of unknown function (DUF1559)
MTARRRIAWDSNRVRVQASVVAVLLLLVVGLILTAVVRVRQEAARMTCENHLKQLSLGLLGYHDTQDRLPPLVDQGEGSPTGHGLPSVFATLEPFLEARPVIYRTGSPPEKYHAHSSTPFTYLNKDGTTGTTDGGMANESWKLFVCPADDTASQLRDIPVTLPDGCTGHYATGSYVANGMAPWGSREFKWGASGTILFAERPQACRTAAGDTVHTLWGVGFYSPQMPTFAALTPAVPAGLWNTGQIAPVVPLPDSEGEVWVRIGWANAEPRVPDFAAPFQYIRTDRPCDPRLPGSLHPNGMQTLMGDGSVRAFRYDTTPWVFWIACAPPPK